MIYYSRIIETKLRKLVETFPVVVVSGARQVGKSTTVQRLFSTGNNCVVFDPTTDVENARRDPDLFLQQHPERPLILDEIQYAPELVAALKRQVDRDRTGGRFILTGSQQWEVMKSLSESLAGRAVFCDMEGFSISELAEEIGRARPWLGGWLDHPDPASLMALHPTVFEETLAEQLYRGWLPEPAKLPLSMVPTWWQAYLRTYIERDARLFAAVSDWHQFDRFIRMVFTLTAQEINISEFGREIGVAPGTAARWLSILKGTFQWVEIPPWSANTVKRVSRRAKGYAADSGLACHVQMISSHRALLSHPTLGAIFETAVVGELRKQAAGLDVPPRMYHFRSAGGAEVDVLLERDGRLYPMEIKLTSRPARRHASGISALRRAFPDIAMAPGLVLCTVEKPLRLSADDIAIPWNGGFSGDHPGRSVTADPSTG